MEKGRYEALSDFIHALGLEELEGASLIDRVDQSLTHASSGKAKNLEKLELLLP